MNVIERNKLNNTDRKIADFRVKQQQDYIFKKTYAKLRAWEFYNHPDIAGNAYVAVGGLDSITLTVFLRSIGIWVPAVSVSSLEDKSIQELHRQIGVIALKPLKSKIEVIKEYGWPVLSKETAGKIALLQNPSAKNATVRHAIITGETGEYGGNRKGTRMKLAQKWLEKFGGSENERENVNYQTAPIKVSEKCCYYLKEKPCNDYARETGSYPYMALMASEGGRREKALMMHGCNYISPGTKRSCPFAIFSRQDILQLNREMTVWLRKNWGHYREGCKRELNIDLPQKRPETLVPAIYGHNIRGLDRMLRTTKAQRTGCSMCGFGIHLEKRPHRFDRLREDHPKEWEFWMHHVMQDENGEWYGWGRVLDYIGVHWTPETLADDIAKQEAKAKKSMTEKTAAAADAVTADRRKEN